VSRAVVALDFEKQVLHFAQRAAVNGVGELFHRAREPGFATIDQPRKKIGLALCREKSPLCRNGQLQLRML
jgi:hypothetical protein